MNSKNIPFALLVFLLGQTTALRAQFSAAHIITETTAMTNDEHFVLDMDNDGDKDIVVVSQYQPLSLFRNDGTGHFAAPEIAPGLAFYRPFFMDFNHDSLPDVLIQCPGNFVCWAPNDGDGTFSNVVPIGPFNFFGLVDMNNDGELDLLYQSSNAEFKWLENEGGGIFIDSHPYYQGAFFESYNNPGLKDINGDGRLDFVYYKLFNFDYLLCWRLTLPDGSLSAMEQVLQTQDTYNHEFADLDYDGDLDLAYEETQTTFGIFVKWRENMGGAGFGPPTTIAEAEYTSPFLVADYNEDGYTDISFQTPRYGKIAWVQNDGTGHFTFHPTYISPKGNWLFEDISGDQVGDLIFINGSSLSIGLGNGAGGFGPAKCIYPEFAVPFDVIIADADADGDQDVFYNDGGNLEIGWFRNEGQGNFSQKNVVEYNFQSYNLFVGDLDNDGYPELSPRELDSLQLVWSGAPNGDYGIPDTLALGLASHYISAATDVDGDNDLDWQFFAHAPWTNTVTYSWLANDGAGNFTPALAYESAGPVFVDIDADGLADGITWSVSELFWSKNNGNGDFGPLFTIGQYHQGGIQGADLDLDGDQDLILSSPILPDWQNSYLFWLENQNNGGNWVEHLLTLPSDNARCLGDFNQDGALDICIGTSIGDSVEVNWYANDGADNFGDPTFIGRRPGIEHLQSADFDNDGDADVLFDGDRGIGWFENLAKNLLIQGVCFLDANENAQQDSTESALAGVKIKLEPGGKTTFSGPDGAFRFYVAAGDFLLSAEAGDCFEGTTGPLNYQIHLPLPGADSLFVFGFKNKIAPLSLAAPIAAAPTRCGFNVPFWISLQNQGCQPTAAVYSLRSNGLVSFVSAEPAPALVQGDSIVWQSGELLQPGETRTIRALLRVAGTDHLGDTIRLSGLAWATDSAGNPLQAPVTTFFAAQINCAYDPNDKLVNRPTVPASYDPLSSGLVYTIRFQNTGTDTAFNVRVLDTLATELDWATLRPLGASHLHSLTLDGNSGELEYRLDQILLPDSSTSEPASHGFVSFAIQLKPGLLPGALIPNRAAIYFDFNPPVMTNAVETQILLPLAVPSGPESAWSVSIYPNPNAGSFRVELPEAATKGMNFCIVNLVGQELRVLPAQAGVAMQTIQTSDLPAGLYFLQVVQEGKVLAVEKFVKQ